jgi:uncharacterized protein (DUF952 family)
MGLIYHIAAASDWEGAQGGGEYRISTRGKSLAEEGFIHTGTSHQVAPVANAIYGADQDLLVLVIDADRVEPDIRYEQVPGWDDPFPHIYGPLSVHAVVKTVPLERDGAGRFSFVANDE